MAVTPRPTSPTLGEALADHINTLKQFVAVFREYTAELKRQLGAAQDNAPGGAQDGGAADEAWLRKQLDGLGEKGGA